MKRTFKDVLSNTIILLGVFLACFLLMGQIIEVSGDSMDPTVKNHERVLAEKISAKLGVFRRGEIVVFSSPEKKDRLLIKRVVGLPNDRIKITNGVIYINDDLYRENYIPYEVKTIGGAAITDSVEFTIGADEYVMLGDNRGNSIDSREYGPINKESVLGRALFVYSPIRSFRLLLSRPE